MLRPVFILCAAIFGMGTAHADFHSPFSELMELMTPTPRGVLQASRNVVRVSTVGGNSNYNLDTSSLDSAREYEDSYRLADQSFIADQIRYCYNAGIKDCPIFPGEALGSGFLLGRQRRLVSNYHVLYSAITSNLAQVSEKADVRTLIRDFQNLPVFLRLRDESGREVLSSTIRPRSASIYSFNADLSFIQAADVSIFTDNLAGQISDVMVLNVTGAPTLKPLRVARTAPTVGQRVYAVGFPAVLDATGRISETKLTEPKKKISMGTVISTEEFLFRMGIQEPAEVTNLRRRFMIYGDFSCESGSSGGPLLKSDGTVLGVVAGSYDKGSNHICYAINLTSMNRLKVAWHKIMSNNLLQLTHDDK